jgi:SAM-dependent methyltransferase
MLPQTPREALGRIARLYSPLPTFICQRSVELALLARERWVAPLLDLGCGDGGFVEALFGFEPRVDFGVDPDPTAVMDARRRGVYRRVFETGGEAIPLPDASVATVFSNSVLEHVRDVEPIVSEVGRILRPDGRFIFTTPSDRFPDLLATVAARRLRGDAAGAAAYLDWFDRTHRHFHYETVDVWRERLARHGLAVTHWRYFMTPRGMTAFDRWITRQRRLRALAPVAAYRFFERWGRAYRREGPVLPQRSTPWERALSAALALYFRPHLERELASTEPGGQLFVRAVKR